VSKIISKLEEIAKVVSFTVRKKDCRVSLEGFEGGCEGTPNNCGGNIRVDAVVGGGGGEEERRG
jgi:hypothetical protein